MSKTIDLSLYRNKSPFTTKSLALSALKTQLESIRDGSIVLVRYYAVDGDTNSEIKTIFGLSYNNATKKSYSIYDLDEVVNICKEYTDKTVNNYKDLFVLNIPESNQLDSDTLARWKEWLKNSSNSISLQVLINYTSPTFGGFISVVPLDGQGAADTYSQFTVVYLDSNDPTYIVEEIVIESTTGQCHISDVSKEYLALQSSLDAEITREKQAEKTNADNIDLKLSKTEASTTYATKAELQDAITGVSSKITEINSMI